MYGKICLYFSNYYKMDDDDDDDPYSSMEQYVFHLAVIHNITLHINKKALLNDIILISIDLAVVKLISHYDN